MTRVSTPSPRPPARAGVLLGLLAPLLAPVVASLPAAAGQSDPVAVSGGAVRLLGGSVAGGHAAAGLEIDLLPHWKTYWRYPGDAGVPPQVSFAGSTNVKAVRMDWPAPRRFTDKDATSIGYRGQTVFPLEVTLADPAKPAVLNLALDFAVCEALCLPARAELALPLTSGADPAVDARLALARSRVPVRQALGAEGALSVLKVTLEPPLEPRTLVVEARAGSAASDLFVEGPTSDWALPLPQKTALASGLTRFTLPLEGVPSAADVRRTPLTLTLVDGQRAVTTEAVPSLVPATAAGIK